MTQKELLYYEDAIGHEENIIKICEESVLYLEDADLISFFQKEIKKHTNTKDKLIKLLKEKSNDW